MNDTSPTAAPEVDLLVVGGGINGAGIARDAAGRGLRVMLVEQGDFAGATSSASTKLIHGGLRYLEYREWRLVAEALAEREVLLRLASHIAWPLRFVLPHVPELRPAWMIRTGLWLYDHLGGRSSLPRSHGVRLQPGGWGAGLQDRFKRGFVYADAWVDDARLVILNLRSAQAHGAVVWRDTRMINACVQEGRWLVTLEPVGLRGPGGDGSRPVAPALQSPGTFAEAPFAHAPSAQADGYFGSPAPTVNASPDQPPRRVRARAIVNAAGAWVGQVRAACVGREVPRARLVRGSHLVVPRIHPGDHAYILQHRDGRIVFAIPYEQHFTLIGTTDHPVQTVDEASCVGDDEVRYLLDAVNRYLARPLTPGDARWSYSGVRPLADDGADDPKAVTRDYRLELDDEGGALLLSVYGGKLTTYRKLAEAALERLAAPLGARRRPWTATETLPGAPGDRPSALRALLESHPGLPADALQSLFSRHGTDTEALLAGAQRPQDLGTDYGGGLWGCEARWCREHEWARSADDVLWRRTKTGLQMTPAERERFTRAWNAGGPL